MLGGEGSLSGSSINAATILQFNATVMVGVFLFLTLSTSFFGVDTSSQDQENNITSFEIRWQTLVPDLIKFTQNANGVYIQLLFTSGIIIPFSISSIIIIMDEELFSTGKKWTVIGMAYLLTILTLLIVLQAYK